MLDAAGSEFLKYRTTYAIRTGNRGMGIREYNLIQYVHVDESHRVGFYFVNNNNPFHDGEIVKGEPLYVYSNANALAINRALNGWAFWGLGYPIAGAALMVLWGGPDGRIRRGEGFIIRHFSRTPLQGIAASNAGWPGFCYFTDTSGDWLSFAAYDPAEMPNAQPPMPVPEPA